MNIFRILYFLPDLGWEAFSATQKWSEVGKTISSPRLVLEAGEEKVSILMMDHLIGKPIETNQTLWVEVQPPTGLPQMTNVFSKWYPGMLHEDKRKPLLPKG